MKKHERYYSTKLRTKKYGNLSFMRIFIENAEIFQEALRIKEMGTSADGFSSINWRLEFNKETAENE